MKVPTPDQVMFWNVDMGSVAPKAELIAKGIRDAADDMHKTIDGMNWSGDGRNGAEHRSERERSQMRFNSAAYAAVSELNQQFGLTEGSGSSSHNYRVAEWAGRIDQTARDGMQAEFAVRNLDATAQGKEQTALFDSVREGTAFVSKRMPVIGSDMLELAVKSGSPEVKMWLLGSVPDSHVTVDLTSDANPSQRYHSILAGMSQASGQHDFRSDPNVGQYFDQTTGKLKSLEEIAGKNPQTTLTEFDSAMRNFLPNLANYDASWTLGHSPNELPK
ncbi:hypothetical protein OHB26_08350 [Nocardia sp. NBC_01503]|uniref:hypothetical protein n=1 Tax=Nocardia sp. NBC_01503 TaxID=2975997 RepID=UPI002E7AD15F|nr:hypothetical protein [Nocardia sp. NBC_01503]WTL34201.1 hypothetical protein OHB26_08350 [Nocardia sp. NBC_01503]